MLCSKNSGAGGASRLASSFGFESSRSALSLVLMRPPFPLSFHDDFRLAKRVSLAFATERKFRCFIAPSEKIISRRKANHPHLKQHLPQGGLTILKSVSRLVRRRFWIPSRRYFELGAMKQSICRSLSEGMFRCGNLVCQKFLCWQKLLGDSTMVSDSAAVGRQATGKSKWDSFRIA